MGRRQDNAPPLSTWNVKPNSHLHNKAVSGLFHFRLRVGDPVTECFSVQIQHSVHTENQHREKDAQLSYSGGNSYLLEEVFSNLSRGAAQTHTAA